VVNGRPAVAPGQLGLVQAFLNTRDLESGRDDLDTTGFDEADRRRLVEARQAIGDLVAANGGPAVERRAITTLNDAARRVHLGVRLHPQDGYRLVAEGVGADRPIGDLLIAITASMAADTWSRLKICANDACQRAFYDASRNRSGRWCSMAVCGNRMKGRNYRRRHSDRGAEAASRRTQAAAG